MQSKFQNKVLLPKKTREVHFITSLKVFAVALIYNSEFHYSEQGFVPNYSELVRSYCSYLFLKTGRPDLPSSYRAGE
jgi:hypothetical protein